MNAMIETVNGPLKSAPSGIVLVHEHLLIDYGELIGRPRKRVDARTVERLERSLKAAAEDGVSILIDCTPPHYGRYLDVMRTVASNAGLSIVAATGSFCEAWAPLPAFVVRASVEELAEWFQSELLDGAGSTTIRAGVIKAATSASITHHEAKILRAAGRAQAATSAPIVSHTTAGLGLEQLDIYEQAGADPARILISHVGSEEDPIPYARSIADRGAYVGFDRIGHHEFFADDHWVDLIIRMKESNHLDRVLLSHDAVTRFSGPDELGEHTFSNYSYIPITFLAALEDAGLCENDINTLTVGNPHRWLFGSPERSSV